MLVADSYHVNFKITININKGSSQKSGMDVLLSMFPGSRNELQLEILDTKLLNPPLAKLFDSIIEEIFTLRKNATKEDLSDSTNLLIRIESLLDFVWEHLHTGEWKNVDIFWRYMYSYTSLLKTYAILINRDIPDQKRNLIQAIMACDMGLIMGAPILDGLLHRIGKRIHEVIIQNFDGPCFSSSETQISNITFPNVDSSKSVDSFKSPSIEMFLCNIMDKKPAILTGNLSSIEQIFSWRWDVLLDIRCFGSMASYEWPFKVECGLPKKNCWL